MDLQSISSAARASVVDQLLAASVKEAAAGRPTEQAWELAQAAHIVGQSSFPLHWRVHRHMLAMAARERNPREAAGQLFRLALIPLGHLLGRLPVGNHGRSTVSAFRSMQVPEHMNRLILDAIGSQGSR
jgi:hypothetical protein